MQRLESQLRLAEPQKKTGSTFRRLAVRLRQFAGLGSKDFLHGPALGQFIDELVEITDLLHELIFDFFDAVAADQAGDLGDVRVDLGCLSEEGFEVDFVQQELLEGFFVVAGEPVDDGVQLFFGTAFFFDLGDVVRIDTGEGHFEDFCIDHGLFDSASLTEIA
jgi:hypothetical protein